MPRYFAPTIPGSLGNRQGPDATTNRLESETARQLALPRPDLHRIALRGDDGQSFSNGLMVSAALTTGANTIAHGLGRIPVGVMPYHSDASGLAPGYTRVLKNGNLALPNAGAWNSVTGWTESADPYSCFAADAWTCPRTGIYNIVFSAYFGTVLDGNFAGARILNATASVASSQTISVGANNDVELTVVWNEPITASNVVQFQVYRPAAALTVYAASNPTYTRANVIPAVSVDAYSWDATNIYVHSDYDHTRSFWVF